MRLEAVAQQNVGCPRKKKGISATQSLIGPLSRGREAIDDKAIASLVNHKTYRKPWNDETTKKKSGRKGEIKKK